MPTVQAPVQLTVEHLLAAIRQLSPAERRELAREFAALPAHNGAGEHAEDEAALLARIEENSRLPDAEQRRFNRLRRKRQAEKLATAEAAELEALWQRVERMNAARLEALAELAGRRGTDVRTLMRELGLREKQDVF
jgi:hypothetical protein